VLAFSALLAGLIALLLSFGDGGFTKPFLWGALLVGVGLLLRIEAAILSIRTPTVAPGSEPSGRPIDARAHVHQSTRD
jgi:hypothetical protein